MNDVIDALSARDDDNTVTPAADEEVDIVPLQHRLVVTCSPKEAIASTADSRFDPFHQLAIEGINEVGNEDTDRRGMPTPQIRGNHIRPVSELGCSPPHMRGCMLAHRSGP